MKAAKSPERKRKMSTKMEITKATKGSYKA